MNTIESLERRVRRLRQAISRSPSFLSDIPESDEDRERDAELKQALAELRSAREVEPQNVGPYSGLTRSELGKTRTCETDWF